MRIEELKKEIEEQRERNISLFKIFEYKMHKEEMQPLIQEWREGSKKLKSMLQELAELERVEKDKNKTKEIGKIFINSFGEATKRNITCNGYERAEKQKQKAILAFIGR